MTHRTWPRRSLPAFTLACLAACLSAWTPASQAAWEGRDQHAAPVHERRDVGGDRGQGRGMERGVERIGDFGHDRYNGRGPERGRWVDSAHGHNHAYPSPGYVVVQPPPHARPVPWGGVNYRFHQGVWYSPGPRGYAVVRPPRGIWVSELPLWRTVVLIAGVSYLYANGTYYREQADGGYLVVDAPTPVSGGSGYAAVPASDKVFVYPRKGQSPQLQASDEYDCHRWAVGQTGFDPTAAATGQGVGFDAERRNDYQRARGACLDARGYTVK